MAVIESGVKGSLRRMAVAIWGQFPPLGWLGFGVIVMGTLADFVAHATHPGIQQGFTFFQQAAHFVILLGMLVTLEGVLIEAYVSSRRGKSRRNSQEVSDVSRPW